MLHDGEVDIYLCGPPPMVDAVSEYMKLENMTPANFYYERFIPSV
jgi:benzoate/toluate 1,2-dioxygenase reductase subunit